MIELVAMIFALFVALLAHELAHIALSRAYGVRVGGFRLSLLGATAWVCGLEKIKPWQRYAVYIAGPAANALLAAGALAAARFLYDANGFAQAVFLYNAVLSGFNLLPVLPLDGGRLVQLLLGNRIGILRANRVLAKTAPVVGGTLIVLGLVQAILYPWNLTLLCAGVYIKRKNKQLQPQLYWEFLKALQAKDKNIHRIKKIILPKNTTTTKALEYLRWDYFAHIYIGNGRCVPEDELTKAILRGARS